jgi:hypothetical protein
MTIIKLHKIHFMAMGYKTDFEHENDKRSKNKVNLDHAQGKMTMKATPSGKSNYPEKNKHLKHKVLSGKQLMP